MYDDKDKPIKLVHEKTFNICHPVIQLEMGNETPSTTAGATVIVPTSRRMTNSAHIPASLINKINQPQAAPSAALPNVHVAAPPPPPPQQTARMALHHVHSIAPLPMQHGQGPWPIVDPVFHFGPGFEMIQHYCPTHSQGPQPHEHVVFFHVNAGVSVTFQIAGNREVIRGKLCYYMCT